MTTSITIDLREFYTDTAKVQDLPKYVARAKELAGEGREVVLTGQAPIWMYLPIAHALHGLARRLVYRSPNTKDLGDIVVFDHNPL